MANRTVIDTYTRIGPYNYEPTPSPDNISRTFKSINYSEGGGYDGEVDD